MPRRSRCVCPLLLACAFLRVLSVRRSHAGVTFVQPSCTLPCQHTRHWSSEDRARRSATATAVRCDQKSCVPPSEQTTGGGQAQFEHGHRRRQAQACSEGEECHGQVRGGHRTHAHKKQGKRQHCTAAPDHRRNWEANWQSVPYSRTFVSVCVCVAVAAVI